MQHHDTSSTFWNIYMKHHYKTSHTIPVTTKTIIIHLCTMHMYMFPGITWQVVTEPQRCILYITTFIKISTVQWVQTHCNSDVTEWRLVPFQKIKNWGPPVLYYCAHIKQAYVQLILLFLEKSLIRNNLRNSIFSPLLANTYSQYCVLW
jgi:hypothetical protein